LGEKREENGKRLHGEEGPVQTQAEIGRRMDGEGGAGQNNSPGDKVVEYSFDFSQ